MRLVLLGIEYERVTGANSVDLEGLRPEVVATRSGMELQAFNYTMPGAESALPDFSSLDPKALALIHNLSGRAMEETSRANLAEAKLIEVEAERDEARELAEERKEGDDAWRILAQAKGTYSAAEAAGILLNYHGVRTGEQIIKQHLTLQPRTYPHPHTGERVRGQPQLRTTHAGLSYILKKYKKELAEAEAAKRAQKREQAEQLTLDPKPAASRGGAFGSCEVSPEPRQHMTSERIDEIMEEEAPGLKAKLKVVKGNG